MSENHHAHELPPGHLPGDHVPHVTPLRTYIATWLALIVLTAITVGVSRIDFGSANFVIAMVVATEELSAASLPAAGSLITRPEILAKALLQGGTEEQKKTWLPRVASGELMVAVAVTDLRHTDPL